MSDTVNLIFPHQLFKQSELLENGFPIYLVEEYLFFLQYPFHKQKLAFHRASMKTYQHYLEKNSGAQITYIESTDDRCDVRQLFKALQEKGVRLIHYIDPCDDWLEQRIHQAAAQHDLELHEYTSDLFLNSKEQLSSFFKPGKKKFFQTTFYKEQRISRDLLLEPGEKPVGGKWSFDAENRKKYPKNKQPPTVDYPKSTDAYQSARQFINTYFPNNPGTLTDGPLYPHDFVAAEQWLEQFLQRRFEDFGVYEDAIVADESILNHSVLSPLINVGLLTPQLVIDKIIDFAESADTPINSVEGLVRQIIGWREFIRGVYVCKGGYERC